MTASSFKSDLEKEKRLSGFLDALYDRHLTHYTHHREKNLSEQHSGVDVVFTHLTSGQRYFIDEKAQLDYINEDLPTFAFELSYLKQSKRKKGWLFDPNKKTQFYALVTGIFSDAPNCFTAAKITLVNRQLLIHHLGRLHISEDTIGLPKLHGRHLLSGLDPNTEGYLFLSKKNKAEAPLNLILRLDYLIAIGVAKRLV